MESILRELRSLREALGRPSSPRQPTAVISPDRGGNGNGEGNGNGGGKERNRGGNGTNDVEGNRKNDGEGNGRNGGSGIGGGNGRGIGSGGGNGGNGSVRNGNSGRDGNGGSGNGSGNGGPSRRTCDIGERLRAQGVDEFLVRRLQERMLRLSAGEDDCARNAGQPSALAGDFGGAIEDLARAAGDFAVGPLARKAALGPGPRKIALVGPTGVGKTTTLAKIASHHALRENKTVALVTLDTYRIAAAEQLRTYARLLGVPIEVVWDGGRLCQTLERFAGVDYVLIDTPGCSPRDRKSILRLAAVLAQDPGIDIHLVIPSGLRPEETRRVIEGFRPLGCGQVILSKLDEAGTWGNVLNTWILDGLDVSYFTTGQRVPEDLESASLEWLCRALLTSELARVD